MKITGFVPKNVKKNIIKIRKKIKCQRCGEMFYEVDIIIETKVVPNQQGSIGWDWGIPIWEEYEIRKCPKCKSILYYVLYYVGNAPSP